MNTQRKSSSQSFRYLTLAAIFAASQLVALAISGRFPRLSTFEWIALAFASSMGGRAVAYLNIFEWLRAPFVVVGPHSAGVGDSIEPRTDKGPLVHSLGDLICCPICAGTWVALVLAVLVSLSPSTRTPAGFGFTEIYILAAAGLGAAITRTIEMIEWLGRYALEIAGRENRYNKDMLGRRAEAERTLLQKEPELSLFEILNSEEPDPDLIQ